MLKGRLAPLELFLFNIGRIDNVEFKNPDRAGLTARTGYAFLLDLRVLEA